MPRGSAGRRVRFWPSFLRVVGLLGARSTICYLIATGDGRGIRIGFSAFRGRAVLKECLEFGVQHFTSRSLQAFVVDWSLNWSGQYHAAANVRQEELGNGWPRRAEEEAKNDDQTRCFQNPSDSSSSFLFQSAHTHNQCDSRTDTDTDFEAATCVNPWIPKLELVIGNLRSAELLFWPS